MNASTLVKICTEKNITIGSCESLTAGLFSSSVASIPGASRALKGGIVTYWTQIKTDVVHVDPEVIAREGVVSLACACEMAQKTREILDVDYCVSFTGNAGPDVLENKPAGTVCCAIATKTQVRTFEFHYMGLNRNKVRENVVSDMIIKLIQVINEDEENNYA